MARQTALVRGVVLNKMRGAEGILGRCGDAGHLTHAIVTRGMGEEERAHLQVWLLHACTVRRP